MFKPVENIIIAQPSSDPFMKKCFLKKVVMAATGIQCWNF